MLSTVTKLQIIIICLSMRAFGEYQHFNHRYDDKQDTSSFNDSAKNTPLSLEYRDFEEDSSHLTTHSSDSDHRFNDSNNSYDTFSHYTDYIDEGNEEINPDTEYGYHDMTDYDDEEDERDDINDRPVEVEATSEHNEKNKKEKENLILVTPLPPENYTNYEDDSHSDEILKSYEDSGEKSSQGIPGTYDSTRGEKSSKRVPGSYDVNSDEKSNQDVPVEIFKLRGEKSSRHVSGAYEVTTQWSEDIKPTKSKPSVISQRYADFSENYKKPKYTSYYRPIVRNNFQNKFKNTVGQVRSVQRPGNVYSSVSKSNGDVYYGYEILHVPNNGQQKLLNDHNTYGNTASAGRVKIQVYRGHSKSDGNNNWYTPWGYYISQPAYS